MTGPTIRKRKYDSDIATASLNQERTKAQKVEIALKMLDDAVPLRLVKLSMGVTEQELAEGRELRNNMQFLRDEKVAKKLVNQGFIGKNT